MIDVRSSRIPIIILRNTKAEGKFKKILKTSFVNAFYSKKPLPGKIPSKRNLLKTTYFIGNFYDISFQFKFSDFT